jgi:ribosomal protein S6--L-glutamate ligase
VNSSPGLEGIEKSTSIDVAGMVIDYVEKNYKPVGKNKNKTKGKG